MLYITNSSSEIFILSPKEAIGILDLRSLGYYKIQQGVLQQNLSTFYKFESVENVCNQFNNLTLSMPHVTIVAISHLVKKVLSLEL